MRVRSGEGMREGMSLDRQTAGRLPGPAAVTPDWSFVVDLDGTLVRDGTPVPAADRLIGLIDGRFVVVSNNSTHSAADMAVELASRGLPIPADKLVLAGAMAVRLVARDYSGARVLLVGSPGFRREAERAHLDLVDRGSDIVLLGRDVAFTYDTLALVANEIRRGAILVATNPDTTHPGADGALIPETGALMRAITACATPRAVRVIGKPQPDLFQEALRRLGSAPGCSVVIGDNPETDAAGALQLGMPCLLIGSSPDCDAEDLPQLVSQLAQGPDSLPIVRRSR